MENHIIKKIAKSDFTKPQKPFTQKIGKSECKNNRKSDCKRKAKTDCTKSQKSFTQKIRAERQHGR